MIILLTFLNEDSGLVCNHFVFRAKRCCSKGGESRLLSGRGGSWSLGLVFHRLGLVPFHFSCSLFGSPGVGWNLARWTLFSSAAGWRGQHADQSAPEQQQEGGGGEVVNTGGQTVEQQEERKAVVSCHLDQQRRPSVDTIRSCLSPRGK